VVVLVVAMAAAPALAAGGGPDGFGYRWSDSDEPSVIFDYEYAPYAESMADDDYEVVSIGFDFEFYDVTYTTVTLTSNGMIHFDGNTYISFDNQPLPYSNYQMIAPMWDDLNPADGGSVYWGTIGTAPERVFIAEWWGVPHYEFPVGIGAVYFEVKLFEEDGAIEFHYLDADFGEPLWDAGASATVGVQDGGQGYALEVSCDTASLSNGYAIRIEPPVCPDDDADGYEALACGGTDCDDTDPGNNPGATEVCDGADNDCDGVVDEQDASGCITYYFDADGDGYGETGSSQCWCSEEGNYRALLDGDCDDYDATAFPGAIESCDARDNDCDGDIDEANADGCLTYYFDADNDDYGITGDSECLCGPDGDYRGDVDGDCDDSDPTIHPGAVETCDGADNDCDAVADEQDAANCTTYFYDGDDDGYGITGDSECWCSESGLYRATASGDCDDVDPSVYPGATELCNGLDDNCDGAAAWDEADDDGDGYMMCSGDCDDSLAAKYPGAPQDCDGIGDNDCDGVMDSNEEDADHDTYSLCDDDCDDTEATAYPGGVEQCDGLDNDCNGAVDDVDADGDGQLASDCGGMDCDDFDAEVYQGAPELCDGADNDCDGSVPAEEITDTDGDGWVECEECDDTDGQVYPGAAEACDGADSDCDGDLPEDEYDEDGDEHLPCEGDCDDLDDTVYPGAPELCDGVDNDCDPVTDEFEDNDGDGWSACEGDCDDGDLSSHPEAVEICDGADNDCNGQVDDLGDGDGDGYSICDDCNDGDPTVHPAAEEVCDGADNDCDGAIDDVDADEDGYVDPECGGDDCDDSDAAVNPGAEEVCEDGVDNDCDGGVDEDDEDCPEAGDDDTTEVGDDDTVDPTDDDLEDPAFGACECRLDRRAAPSTVGLIGVLFGVLALRRRTA